jgi:hypothetical protein
VHANMHEWHGGAFGCAYDLQAVGAEHEHTLCVGRCCGPLMTWLCIVKDICGRCCGPLMAGSCIVLSTK